MIKDYALCSDIVNSVNQAGGTYHQLNLGENLIIQGDYDMTQYLPLYQIPEDLTGKRMLDVGTASGFFAIECARRGAQVVAIDIWDSQTNILNGIVKCTDLKIEYVQKSVYDLESNFGLFDLVVCGSLLSCYAAKFNK